jgi:hypothetical protein
MGRDAGGHGHDPGENGNPNHDKLGEFSSGGGGDSGGGGRKQAWSKPSVTLDKKASAERKRVGQAKEMKENAKRAEAKADDKKFDQKKSAEFKEAKTEDKAFDKTRGAERREADKEDRARDRAAAKGDHQNAQQHFGHGSPIRAHMGVPSVGTGGSTGGGGGGGSGGGIGAKLSKLAAAKPIKTASLRQSAKEAVAQGQMIDATHFPTGDDAQRIARGRITNVPQSKRSF